MKKVLSVILGAMMLVSSVSAAIPLENSIDTTETEAVLVSAQTYEDSTYKFFTKKQNDSAGIVTVKENPDDAESNTVMELKYSALLTFEEVEGEDGTTTQTVLTTPRYNNAQLTDGVQNTNILSDGTEIPVAYMVEFDVCAKDNSLGLVFSRRGTENNVQASVAIDPDSMTEGMWYTYRFYIDESGYRAIVPAEGSTSVTSAEATSARTAFKNGISAFRKERGSAAAFEDVTSNLISTVAGNGAMGFVLLNNNTSNDKLLVAEDVDQTKTYYMESSKRTVFVDAFSACYQLDNIALYSHTVPEDYEINAGIASTYDMNTVTTGTRENGVKFEKVTEENGNSYMKISCDSTSEKLTAANAAKVGYSVDNKITTGTNLAEYFSMTFDANNMVAGLALTLEIYSDDDGYTSGGTDCYGRNKFIIKSDPNLVGEWYTYKIILDDSANDGNLHARVYRKLRGSNDPWVETVTHKGAAGNVDSTVHEAFLQGTNSSNVAKARTWRIGYFTEYLSAYGFDTDANKVKNFAGVWAIDNVQFVEGAGVTGIASAADGTVTAKINVSGAKMSCAPIVAIFDADERFVDMGFATVTGEGSVRVTADGWQDGYTAKLFIWESVSAGMPLLKDGIDITNCL